MLHWDMLWPPEAAALPRLTGVFRGLLSGCAGCSIAGILCGECQPPHFMLTYTLAMPTTTQYITSCHQ